MKPGRAIKPFNVVGAAHTLARVAEQLNWQIDDAEKFLERAQHVEYGLSAEIEFATILRWLGVCKLVHRLSEDVLIADTHSATRIPDLFAVFQHDEHQQCALIEVKTSEDMHLEFTKAYLDGLRYYATLANQPLLIAWKSRQLGFWTLFDPLAIPEENGRVRITIDHAMRNDLMGHLAGDVCFVPVDGSGLRFVAQRTSEKTPTRDGYQAMFTITQAGFFDAKGREHKVTNALSWLILSTIHYQEEITDEQIIKSFLCEGFTRAQVILRTAVSFSLKEDERIHWKAVYENLNDILTCDGLVLDASQAFGSFVKYILFQHPQTCPEFLQRWVAPRLPSHP